jgi:hypothetical protein
MPVAREIRCFACVIPTARFHENENPNFPMKSALRALVYHVQTEPVKE